MNKLCLVFLGALLFALHLAPQVQAQTSTVSPKNTNTTGAGAMTTTTATTTRAFKNTVSPNSTASVNVTQANNGCGPTEVSLVLLPLALAGFIHGWH